MELLKVALEKSKQMELDSACKDINNIPRCGMCGEAVGIAVKMSFGTKVYPRACRCRREAYEKQQKESASKEKQIRLEQVISNSMMNTNFRKWTLVKMSRSSRSTLFSLRSRTSSSRSAVVSPSRRPESTSAWRTHSLTAVSVSSRSRETLPTVLPGWRTSSTTSALNSGENDRRGRRCFPMVSILDILSGASPLMVDVRQTGSGPRAAMVWNCSGQDRGAPSAVSRREFGHSNFDNAGSRGEPDTVARAPLDEAANSSLFCKRSSTIGELLNA